MSKFYNLSIKEYENGETKYTFYKNSVMYDHEKHYAGIRGQARYPKHSLYTSLQRTKNQIIDLAKNNPWDLFITITFDKNKVDRYNYDKVANKLSRRLKYLKHKKCNNLQYILVPELHKDGAIHFHGLLSNISALDLVDSGKKTRDGQTIYNMPDFNLGFTTATLINDTKKASYYISKYITKEMIAVSFNRKRYWRSRDLTVPKPNVYLYNEKDTNQLVSTLNMISVHSSSKTLIKNNLEIQEIKYFYM